MAIDPAKLVADALGDKLQTVSLADRDRMVQMVLALSKAQQAPVEAALTQMMGLLTQLVSQGAAPRVIERVIQGATRGETDFGSVEVTPELVGRLIAAANVRTNIDQVKVDTGESVGVDDAVERLKKLQGGG